MESNGGGGIRTHERLATPTVFETAPFNRSAPFGALPDRFYQSERVYQRDSQ